MPLIGTIMIICHPCVQIILTPLVQINCTNYLCKLSLRPLSFLNNGFLNNYPYAPYRYDNAPLASFEKVLTC